MISGTRWIGGWSSGWWIVFEALVRAMFDVARGLKGLLPRSLLWLAASAFAIGSAEAEVVTIPASYTSKCASCHGTPPGTGSYAMPFLGDNARLGSATSFRNFLDTFSPAPGHPSAGTTPMFGLVTNDADANQIRAYLLTVRDALVRLNGALIATNATSTSTFPTSVSEGSSSAETVTIRIANARFTALQSVSLTGTLTNFGIVSNTCSASPAIPAVTAAGTNAAECEIGIKFSPSVGTTNGQVLSSLLQLNLTFAGGHAPASVQYPIQISGTSAGPAVVLAPAFSPSGFNALSTFSAPPTGSQTLCPTIQNSGTADLSLSFAAAQAAGSGADHSSYFELGDSASCPATPRACNVSMPAGSPISGGTTLQFGASPADSACTLALRFNPAKFGAAGGSGARSALLRITHNAPIAGTVSEFVMTGNVTIVTQPRIGLFTNPGVVGGRVSPPAFAAQVTNVASTLWNEFLVFNTGTAAGLDLTEVTHTNPQEFALTENCVAVAPLAITSGSNDPHCTVGLTFTPTAVGQRCTTVTVRAAVSSNGAQSLNICGTGVALPAPALSLSRTSIDFGRRAINGSYPPELLVISNGAGASAPLQITTVTPIGSGFVLVPGATCSNISLAPGSSCTVQIQFTPDPSRPETVYAASLQIDSNDPVMPRQTVSLAAVAGGLATPPVLQFTSAPGQLEFSGFVVAGQQSEQVLTVALRNAGPANAEIQSIRMVGADASSFSVNGCPSVLTEGESCAISLRFVPGSGGFKRAQLEVVSSRSVTPSLLTVIGRGVGGAGAFLTASAGNLSLGSVRVGAQSAPFELRLASAGDGVVTVTGMEAGAPFAVQSKTCPSVPFTLPRGGDCTVTVTFSPTDARAASGVLRISSDSDSNALEVPLTAIGEARADVSSGGCSMVTGDTLADPTLWALVVLAITGLLYRRRARSAERRIP